MLNDFLNQKAIKSAVLASSPAEMERLKRTIMNTFASRFGEKVQQYSLRAQLIAIYNSIIRLLGRFPSTRANHFVMGEPNERRLQLTQMNPVDDFDNKDNDEAKSKKYILFFFCFISKK